MLISDMEKINQWAKRWLVSFNPAKSESLLFSQKINKPYHLPVTMNNQIITEVTTHKHLGLTFSKDCTWYEHLAQIKTKAWQRINIMRKLKFVPDRNRSKLFTFLSLDLNWNTQTSCGTVAYSTKQTSLKKKSDWGRANCNWGNKACISKSSIL